MAGGSSGATRREFVCRAAHALTGGAIACVATGVLASCARSAERAKPRLFEATFDVGSLAADGQSIITATDGFDGTPILILRASAQRFVALSMQCTHEGCPVKPPENGIITCPCHGSQYDLEGRVRRGPAQFSLARYDTSFDSRTKRLTVAIDA
ncbi:MAG: ubiquinol-cytochrome c reductase iron-sulfur subunit [Gemmatimonadales bacterium]